MDIPLNTDAVTNKIARIMTGGSYADDGFSHPQSARELILEQLEHREDSPDGRESSRKLYPKYSPSGDSSPDGTNGATKTDRSSGAANGSLPKAIDPSQGHGAGYYSRSRSSDPLLRAIERTVFGR